MTFFLTREDEINTDASIQVLYFFYPNMPFHSKLLHLLSQMEKKYGNVCLASNIESFPSQRIRFAITSVPSLLFMKYGIEVKRLVSVVKKQDIIDAFADILVYNGDKNE